jgi:hypothetical protein
VARQLLVQCERPLATRERELNRKVLQSFGQAAKVASFSGGVGQRRADNRVSLEILKSGALIQTDKRLDL